MSKRFLVCVIMVLVSACATEVDDELERHTNSVEDATEVPGGAELESCMLAESLDDGELAVSSCLSRAPINELGEIAATPLGVHTDVFACSTYYGSCTGVNGCSRATGGGWQYTECGSFIYAWMTVCDGSLGGWGIGYCAW